MARVLVVDDNLLIRTLLRDILDHGGHAVVGEANDGIEALARIGELQPELVILNLVMPRRDGLSALEDLASIAPSVKVIVCSAALTGPKVLRALQLGAKGFIAKPFDRETVLDALTAVVEQAGSQPPLPAPIRQALSAWAGTERDERRNCPRVAVSLPIRLETSTGSSITTRTVDVSGGGLLVAKQPLMPETSIEFALELDPSQRPISGHARVVRSNSQTQQALAFERISVIDHERLIRFLADVQRSAPATANSHKPG